MGIACLISLFCLADKTHAESFKLWGKQTRDASSNSGQEYQGNTITLKKTATITHVEGNALDYTIYRVEPGTAVDVPQTQVSDSTDIDTEPPSTTSSKEYLDYIAAYNKLTSLMAAGKGDTPEAQEAYKNYKHYKEVYEASIGTGAGKTTDEPAGDEHSETPDKKIGTGNVSQDLQAGIRIESATYGGNCGATWGNVTHHIARQCNGKSKCRYTVDHKVIGDPAYGCAKTYTVRYRCGNNPQVFEKALTAEAGWGDKAVLLECADLSGGDIVKPDYPDGKVTSKCGLGERWDETEVGWTGVWIRRGKSNVFDAQWTLGGRKEKAMLTISIHGNTVVVKRQQSSGFSFAGQECTYKGTLAADNVTVTGTYSCAWAAGPFNWQATIRRDPNGDITKTTGTDPIGFTLDFETGRTNGWTKTGTAFNHQPTYGDNPTARRRGQPSTHVGNYWVGTYEKYQGSGLQKPGSIQGDGPIGTLTSNIFTIPSGSLSFLVGGGSSFQTRIELLVSGTRALSVSGRGTETMHRVKWDLNPWAGQQGQIRLVDNASGGWGHINADDFRFSHSSSSGGTSGGGANLVTNGSFEQGKSAGSSYLIVRPGSTNLPGWQITGKNVDVVGSAWKSSHGPRAVDIHGTGPGGIRQSFPTTSGAVYRVSFDLAGNPWAGPQIKTLHAEIPGIVRKTYQFNIKGKSPQNMGWTRHTFTFRATQARSTLHFFGGGPPGNGAGPALDNVMVMADSGGGGGGPAQGTAKLLTGNSNQDMVGRNETFRGNGKYDAIFRAQFSTPNRTVTAVEVSNTNGLRSVWDTRPNNRLWLGGVVIGGRTMNRSDGSVNFSLGSGQNTLDFFVEDNGSIRGGKTNYRMTIFFASGDALIMDITSAGTQHLLGDISKTTDTGSGTGGTKEQQPVSLAGNWVGNGHNVSISQNAQNVKATALENKGPVGWKNAAGEVKGNTVYMNFNGQNLTGNISSQGNIISWSNNATWTRVLSGSGSVGQSGEPGDLGKSWDVTEVYGWTGIWTRQGNSNVFDALWTLGGKQEKAVLIISINRNTVNVKRKQSAGYSYPGQECTYTGTLAADNVTVTGTYGCAWAAGPFNWQATIRRDPNGDITKITGTGSTGLTLDFETGRTNGWTKTGTAFNHQPTYGDNPTARHRGQPSKHIGNYWIGTYEKYQGSGLQKPGSVQGDGPIGTLTSNVFTIPTGSLSFLVGGGSSPQTRIELLVSGTRVLSVSGRGTETMHRVKWDLNPWAGQQGRIRLVDNASGGWGHINADDFRFSHSSSSGGTPGGIRIESATYGGNCGVAKGNVTAHIAGQCNGKSKCRYTVNYKIIGDPAPGCAKTYTVRYRCGNNPQVFEKSLPAESGWGDKSVLLECAGDPPVPSGQGVQGIASSFADKEQRRTEEVGDREKQDLYGRPSLTGTRMTQDELMKKLAKATDEMTLKPTVGKKPTPSSKVLTPKTPSPGKALTDITVNSRKITISFWDHGKEDGDIIDILLNGKVLRGGIVLKNAHQSINVNLQSGKNVFGVRAVNEGSISPNTATVKFSNVTQGKDVQVYEIKSGQKTDMHIKASKSK